MRYVKAMKSMATGAAAGVALVTALPFFGAVGTITAAGLMVGSLVGAAVGLADNINE